MSIVVFAAISKPEKKRQVVATIIAWRKPTWERVICVWMYKKFL